MAGGLWKAILAQYGQKVTLCRGEETREVRAFFQPVSEKAAGEVPTVLGVAPAGKYLYLGPSEESLENVEELRWAGKSFRVLRYRDFPVGEETAHCWAVAEEMDEVKSL
jgi:hypothetical protein